YGRRLIDLPTHVLKLELGAGARQAALADGTMEDESITRGGLSYQWALRDSALDTQGISLQSRPANSRPDSMSSSSARAAATVAYTPAPFAGAPRRPNGTPQGP